MGLLKYDDVWLIPRVISTLKHRHEANTTVECFDIKLSLPIITSPMPDVCNGEMAYQLASLGGLGIIHRFQSITDQVKELCLQNSITRKRIACAIGVTGDYQKRFKELHEAGCRIFCLDTANGANEQVSNVINWIRSNIRKRKENNVYLIAGNVATKEGYHYLSKLGVDAIRVGIAGGSVCETKTETGIHYPMVSSILECVQERNEIAKEQNRKSSKKNIRLPLIIADGGIRTPADMCKALVLGADLVMCGSIFAGTAESPGKVIKHNGKLVKLYRGAASFSVQQDVNREETPEYNEGMETIVDYKGHVNKVVHRFMAGLRSSMSYMNARTLEEYRKNATIVFP